MDIREMAANNPAPPPGFDPENAQNLEDVRHAICDSYRPRPGSILM